MRKVLISILAFFAMACTVAVASDKQKKEASAAQNHEYVDLGLSVLWAKANVGTSQQEPYGKLYAWGETVSKNGFAWVNYKHYGSSLTKYCNKEKFGVVDSIMDLLPEDDVATQLWGNGWRMPKRKEMIELIEGCQWEWTYDYERTGIEGFIGTSKTNGRTIFMPAAGCSAEQKKDSETRAKMGYYWTATISAYAAPMAYYYGFSANSSLIRRIERYVGQSVRAVKDKPAGLEK